MSCMLIIIVWCVSYCDLCGAFFFFSFIVDELVAIKLLCEIIIVDQSCLFHTIVVTIM